MRLTILLHESLSVEQLLADPVALKESGNLVILHQAVLSLHCLSENCLGLGLAHSGVIRTSLLHKGVDHSENIFFQKNIKHCLTAANLAFRFLSVRSKLDSSSLLVSHAK